MSSEVILTLVITNEQENLGEAFQENNKVLFE